MIIELFICQHGGGTTSLDHKSALTRPKHTTAPGTGGLIDWSHRPNFQQEPS